MKFEFRIDTALVTNRSYGFSSFTRMCQSADTEINIPFTEYHYLINITCSLLPWLCKPDAWEIKTDGKLEREKVFEYAEWVECPECGKDVVNDNLDDHIEIRHEGEYKRFANGNTREDYDGR